MREVAIIGVGIHKFGRFGDEKTGYEMGRDAVIDALKDAGIEWKLIQAGYSGSVVGRFGDAIVQDLGLTGIPVMNVSNACATSGSAVTLGYQAVAAGFYDVVLAFGYEKMPRGFIAIADPGASGMGLLWFGTIGLLVNPLYFAMKIRRHMEEYGTTEDQLVKVSVKSHKNGSLNPNAMYQKALTYEEIAESRMVCDPIRLYELCAPNEGGAAVVICSMDVARRYTANPVRIAASVFKTRLYGTAEVPHIYRSATIKAPTPVMEAAKAAYESAGIGPEDLDVAEVQDTHSGDEIMHCEEVGLCPPGEGGRLLDEGATEIGGRIPVNTGGGLISCGEALGASGLRQIHEIVLQLRGDAGPRQVKDAKVGLTQVYGAPGVSSVIILKK